MARVVLILSIAVESFVFWEAGVAKEDIKSNPYVRT
jgi:hypothetical protein